MQLTQMDWMSFYYFQHKSISNGSRQISSRFLPRRTTSNASGIHFYNSNQPDEIRANTD